MSTRQLIDAIASGDSVEIQSAFDASISARIVERLDAMRQDVAQNMFKEAAEEVSEEVEEIEEQAEDLEEADAKVHPDALHVQHVGGGKYKVHAVGKNFADGIKAGEHVSDSELDDFREMGGKVKNVK